MNLDLSGLPAIVVGVGFIIVFALPVWAGAKLTSADNPTLIRSAFALSAGLVGSVIAGASAGGFAIFLVPIVFVIAFRFILGTTVVGAIVLGVIALLGYAAMIHFIGGHVLVSAATEKNV